MAFIFKDYRPLIARRMAAGDDEIRRWLLDATFAKASTGHWLAWRKDEPDRIAVLPPNHPKDTSCRWIESWDDYPIEKEIEYIESGEFDDDGLQVLNLFIENPETGKCE